MKKNSTKIETEDDEWELLKDSEISQTKVDYATLLALQANRVMMSAGSIGIASGQFITAVNMFEALIPENIEDENYKKELKEEKVRLDDQLSKINKDDNAKIIEQELEFHRIKFMLLMQLLHYRGMLKR